MDDLILPNAEWRNPRCMGCYLEVEFDGDVYVCVHCDIWFTENLDAGGYVDEDAEPCGVLPTEYGITHRGWEYVSCPLPVRHKGTHYIRSVMVTDHDNQDDPYDVALPFDQLTVKE